MPLRRQCGGKSGGVAGKARLIVKVLAAAAGIVVAVAVANYIYLYRSELKTFFSTPEPPSAAALDKAIEEAYARIEPVKVSTSNLEAGTQDLRRDRVVIGKKASLIRANYEITSAVERAGGRIVSGAEGADDKGRETSVTLGVSDGTRLIREIRIERGKK